MGGVPTQNGGEEGISRSHPGRLMQADVTCHLLKQLMLVQPAVNIAK